MHEVYLLCLMLGAAVLIVQIVLDTFGGGASAALGIDADAGLDLLSVRTVSAGSALFGAVGLWLSSRGLPHFLSLSGSIVAAAIAMVSTAYLTRWMLRMESSGSLQLEGAVGQSGTVYLPVPAHRSGFGKVQFALQGRTVEMRAVADEAMTLPTGASVIVISVVDGDTVEVTPTPIIEGIDA